MVNLKFKKHNNILYIKNQKKKKKQITNTNYKIQNTRRKQITNK